MENKITFYDVFNIFKQDAQEGNQYRSDNILLIISLWELSAAMETRVLS